jgi:hypothetical protein
MAVRAMGVQFSPPPSSPFFAPVQNPMSVARGGMMFSPPVTSELYATRAQRSPVVGDGITFSLPPTSTRYSRLENRARRRAGLGGQRSDTAGCEAKCAGEWGKGTQGYQDCVNYKCGIAVPPGPGRRRAATRRRNQVQPMGARALSGTIAAAPTARATVEDRRGPATRGRHRTPSTRLLRVSRRQGGYLTCDPLAAGGNHPLHGLEVQIQAVNGDIVTVCHPTFTEQCWRLPRCPETTAPSTCCVRLGQFEKTA